MDQIPPPEEKEDHRPPEDQGDNSLVIDEEKPNEGRIIFLNLKKFENSLIANLFRFNFINGMQYLEQIYGFRMISLGSHGTL
jgi:hypothetical protein